MSRITEQLYIGSALEASDRKWLKDHHISHIVNAAEEIGNYFPNDYVYLNLNMKDDNSQSLYPSLEKTYQFIWKAIGNGGTVLVHCAAGISRSASMVIYFLMKLKGWTYMQSYGYVKTRRPQIDPNQNFARQLVSVSPQAQKVFPGGRNITAQPRTSSGSSCSSCDQVRYGASAFSTAAPRTNPPGVNLHLKRTGGYSYNSVNSLGPGHSLEGMYGKSDYY